MSLNAIITALGVLFTSCIAIFIAGKRKGIDEVKTKQLKKNYDNLKKANQIDKEVEALSDAELDSRLRQYTRK